RCLRPAMGVRARPGRSGVAPAMPVKRRSLIRWSLIRWSLLAVRGSLFWRATVVGATLLIAANLRGDGRRHALLIGINDYSASHLVTPPEARLPFGRDD